MKDHVTVHQIATGDVYLNVLKAEGEHVGVWTMTSPSVPSVTVLLQSVSSSSLIGFAVFQSEESLGRFLDDSAWIVKKRFPQFKDASEAA